MDWYDALVVFCKKKEKKNWSSVSAMWPSLFERLPVLKSGFHLCLIFSVKYNQPTNKAKDGIVSSIIWSSDWFVSFLTQPWFQILLKKFQVQFLWIPTVAKMKIQNQIFFPRHAEKKEVRLMIPQYSRF